MQKNQSPDRSTIYRYMGLGFEFVGILLLPAFIGHLIDTDLLRRKDVTSHLYGIGGLILGFIYGIYYLYKISLEIMRNPPERDSSWKGGRSKENVERDAAKIHRELDDVGEKIDNALKKWRNTKK